MFAMMPIGVVVQFEKEARQARAVNASEKPRRNK